MLSLGALAFATPWALAALISLPVLWWLLRITPPQPRQVTFPPLRLLLLLQPKEETPAHTPWWLLLLRLLIAALAILALAEPILNPQVAQRDSQALVLVIDDGWTGAPRWREKLVRADTLLEAAERDGRPAVLITTAAPANGEAMQPSLLMPAADLRPIVAGLQPKAWTSDRAALVQALLQARLPESANVVWISDGLREDETGASTYTLAEFLQRLGPLSVITSPDDATLALLPPVTSAQGDTVTLRRSANVTGEQGATLRAVTDQGRVLSRERMTFAARSETATLKLDLPSELRNQLSRLEIEEQPSAGTVQLLDDRWRRRPVGLVTGGAVETRQPLLGDLFYLDRALSPYAELRSAPVAELLQREIAVIVLADVAQVVASETRQLEQWIDNGGVLLRFAGPRMAEATDNLLPVKLRQGSRQLGGALSWSQPQRLGATPETSPFFGLGGSNDVTVSRQVLAEPEAQLGEKTWLRLEDGTPLATATQRGKGWLILVHTTANTLWSDLALSGFYVEMLRKVIDLSQGIGGTGEAADTPLPPLGVLDGFGRAVEPGPAVQPIAPRAIATTKPGPRHPPGWYGRLDSRQSLNTANAETKLLPVLNWPAGVAELRLDGQNRELHLLPWLMGAALLLFLADWLIGLGLRGLLLALRRRPAAAMLAVALLLLPGMTEAQQQRRTTLTANDEFALKASLDLRLAYVVTGQADIDQMSRAGLYGLTEVLYRRTSIEAAEPIGVNLEADDISLVPFLYWPITPQQPQLSDAALRRLDLFMKTGGMILFDTRDQAMGLSGTAASPNTEKLRQLLSRLDIPPLMPVPDDHVLTKAFYLMQDFPGRYSGGTLWVERNPGGDKDGVTSIVIGSHDFAAAWAIDNNGRPLAVTVPNLPRQREFAYRFGINLLVYTMTGNYKADQVHVPALLERLGN
ncbi:DUF4159 domain-containing protein [Ferrovibrio terrae]|uniref:DUF4159 domain-containing protein n=1 Tax=Ferrovibrio terrae TaxID=2594003 RepID=A0A516H2U6_9PROT|nr:DUF4159 domain-containing protein [Ferrovibrio terrae]QDO98094.1 DUF4159 domain-containing protein [Ferrovibrio terrae]